MVEEAERLKLKEIVLELESYRGRHTELISVYAPAGSNINQIVSQLISEQSTAQNIKSKTTRKNVIDALERLLRYLKLYKKIPDNGLALFCGNVSETEGQTDIKLWAVEPPQPLKVKFYRCDQVFVLEPLKEMLEVSEVYGLIVIDRKEATFGVLEGKNIKAIRHITSGLPGKFKAGGQCLDPNTFIESNSVIKLKKLKIGDKIKSFDFKNNKIIETTVRNIWKANKKVIRIKTKKAELKASFDHLFFVIKNKKIREIPCQQLKKGDALLSLKGNHLEKTKITSIEKLRDNFDLIDLSVDNENFIANRLLVHNSAQRFERLREEMVKEFFRRVSENAKEIFSNMPKLKNIIVGGPGPTKEDWLKEGELVSTLKRKILAIKDVGYADEHGLKLIVEASQEELAKEEIMAEKAILEKFFTVLAREPEKVAYGYDNVKKALEAGAVSELLLSTTLDKKISVELEKKAVEIAAKIYFISTETNEGVQFKNIAGIGALLRFAV